MAQVASDPPRRSFGAQLFTISGRAHRANYWLTFLIVVVAYSVVLMATLFFFSQSDEPLDLSPAGFGILLLNWLVAGVLYAFAAIRRLHDRDKSGHWIWLFAFLPGLLRLGSYMMERGGLPAPANLTVLFLGLAIFAWGIIELGFLRGTPGPNRFGPDPLTGLMRT